MPPALVARRQGPLLLASVVALAVVGWAFATLYVEQIHFAVLALRAQAGVEAVAAFARLFGALVLGLFFTGWGRQRLHWVAGGLLVLGLGNLGFGYLEAMLGVTSDLNEATYEALVVWTVSGTLFAIGLVPERPPRFGPRELAVALAVFGALVVVVEQGGGHNLPPLVLIGGPVEAVALGGDLPGTAAWHWALSAVPFVLAVAATAGAARGHRSQEGVPGWLLLAMVLFAGAQLHNLFWPSAYSSILSTADVLRLACAAVIVVGGTLELRRVASERAALLVEEKERGRRLEDLSALKADFTAMVAHELGSPVAAVRRLADLLDVGAEDPELRAYAVGALRQEAEALKALVSDVRSTAAVEKEDFVVEVRPVALRPLLDDARAFAESLPGGHPVAMFYGVDTEETVVQADRERVVQVLRNLLSNAAKHCAEGVPVAIRASLCGSGDKVLVEVVDHGCGIHPDDQGLILEKYGRGRDAGAEKVEGVGLGLYISRRILKGHGSDLTVRSVLGEGSVFSFELEVSGETAREGATR